MRLKCACFLYYNEYTYTEGVVWPPPSFFSATQSATKDADMSTDLLVIFYHMGTVHSLIYSWFG